MCHVKMLPSEISQNLQENTCAKASFLIKKGLGPSTLLKKKLWRRCFPVNFAKFLNSLFFTEHLRLAASETQFLNKAIQFKALH